jgi:hypothetical protein
MVFQLSMFRPPSDRTLINTMLWNIGCGRATRPTLTELIWAKVTHRKINSIIIIIIMNGIASHRVEANSNLLPQGKSVACVDRFAG